MDKIYIESYNHNFNLYDFEKYKKRNKKSEFYIKETIIRNSKGEIISNKTQYIKSK